MAAEIRASNFRLRASHPLNAATRRDTPPARPAPGLQSARMVWFYLPTKLDPSRATYQKARPNKTPGFFRAVISRQVREKFRHVGNGQKSLSNFLRPMLWFRCVVLLPFGDAPTCIPVIATQKFTAPRDLGRNEWCRYDPYWYSGNGFFARSAHKPLCPPLTDIGRNDSQPRRSRPHNQSFVPCHNQAYGS